MLEAASMAMAARLRFKRGTSTPPLHSACWRPVLIHAALKVILHTSPFMLRCPIKT